MISVESAPVRDGWDCDLEVDGSRHHVHVTHEDVERWGRGDQPQPDDLLQRAFSFLLEREPASRILKSFELAEIVRYFPDFPEAMTR